MSEPHAGIAEDQGSAPRTQKRALRRHFRSVRSEAVASAGPLILEAARRDLPALLPAGLHLGLYWPLPGEPDLLPLAREHPLLALPAVEGDPPRLLYRPWRPADPLVPDHCGIPAPPAADQGGAFAGPELPPGSLGLLLVPALAFDPRSGIRLGYGGGWYDRLRSAPAWRASAALAVLPSAGLWAGLPREPWDVPFQGWLDEHGVHGLAGRPADAPEKGDPAAGRL